MDFASVRIITDNFDSMVEFYENVTGVTADRPAPVFAELRYPSCTLALGHTSTAALFNNAARPANNQTAILEWVVDDVDALVFESSATHAQGISKGRTRLLPRSLDRSAACPTPVLRSESVDCRLRTRAA